MRKQFATPETESPPRPIPATMRAAVYRGPADVRLETVEVPEIADGEILLKVNSCGVCGTDLKKIELGLAPPPRIFGHEIAGTVARTGRGVKRFQPGDRVAVHHHIPCRDCFYCGKGLYSQCEQYRRTGTTAGYEPAGGGFAQYVRVMDWIVENGTVPIPDAVTFEEATFLEPLNTCLKALDTAGLEAGETVAVFGQGPVGLMLLQAARHRGARVVGLDFIPERLELACGFGALDALSPAERDPESVLSRHTKGRGADLAIVAAADHRAVGDALKTVRRGGRVMLFAQTVPGEMVPVDASRICMEEKKLIGSYSASVELQGEAAHLIFDRRIEVARLVSHRIPLERFPEALSLAARPSGNSMKVLVQP